MDRPLPYLLIVILLIGGWNESFKSRFDRLTGKSEEQPTEETAAEASTSTQAASATTPFIVSSQPPRPTPRYTYTPTPVPTATPTATPAAQQGVPFFNDPNYRNALERSSKKKH